MSATDFTLLSIMRNDDLPVTVTLTDVNGTAVDITGSTCYFTVKANNTDLDASAKIAKSWAVHLDPTAGITSFQIVPADTTALSGKYYFDIQVKTAAGLIYTPIHGVFLVLEDTTLSVA